MTRRLAEAACSASRLVVRPWIAALLYLGLAIAATWPLATNLQTRFAQGASRSDTVPLFNAWTIWWNADRAARGFANYWNAPIFHPTTNTFAYSEPQPMTLIVAPVIWLTGSRILAYNVYLLLVLMLNGVVGNATLRILRVQRTVAFLGGVTLLLLPAVHWQRDVVQLMPLWPSLWTLAALIRLSRRPRLRTGVEAGLAFATTFLTCGHQGLLLALLLCGSGWLLVTPLASVQTGRAWGLAGLVAVAGVLPVALKLHEVAQVRQFERSQQSVDGLSLKPGDYTAADGWQIVDPGRLVARQHWRVSPGFLKYLLAVAGVVLGLRDRRLRRVTVFLSVLGLLAFALSLGGNLELFAWKPWWTIAEMVPGAGQVRNVFRFVFFVQLVVVLLAAIGVSRSWCQLSATLRRSQAEGARRVAISSSRWTLACIGLLAVVEVLPQRPQLGYAPDVEAQRDWIEFVRENTSPGRSVACVPFAKGNQVQDFQGTLWWMLLASEHGVPMVNGYSGFFPQEYFSLRDQVNAQFPKEAVLRQLKDAGVEFVLVDTRQSENLERLQDVASSSVLDHVFEGRAGVVVFRIGLPDAGGD